MTMKHSPSLFFDVLTKEDGNSDELKQKLLTGLQESKANCVDGGIADEMDLDSFTPEIILQELLGELFIHPNRLVEEGKFGEGAFASVHKCVLSAPKGEGLRIQVAVKRLKPEVLTNSDDLKEFLTEANLLRKLRHPNIVGIIGIGALDLTSIESMRSSIYIVMEAMGGDDLKMMVIKQMTARHKIYTPSDALRWCIDVAEGMSYLHTVCKPMIIHRDIKLENIMTSGGMIEGKIAKLADFGLHKRARYSKTHGVLVSGGNSMHESQQAIPFLSSAAMHQAYGVEKSYYGGLGADRSIANKSLKGMKKSGSNTKLSSLDSAAGQGMGLKKSLSLTKLAGLESSAPLLHKDISLLALAEQQTSCVVPPTKEVQNGHRGGNQALAALLQSGHFKGGSRNGEGTDTRGDSQPGEEPTPAAEKQSAPDRLVAPDGILSLQANRFSVPNNGSTHGGINNNSSHGGSSSALAALLANGNLQQNVSNLKLMLSLQNSGGSGHGTAMDRQNSGSLSTIHIGGQGLEKSIQKGSQGSQGAQSIQGTQFTFDNTQLPSTSEPDKSVHRRMLALIALDKCSTVDGEEVCSTTPVTFNTCMLKPTIQPTATKTGGGNFPKNRSYQNLKGEGSMHPIPEDQDSGVDAVHVCVQPQPSPGEAEAQKQKQEKQRQLREEQLIQDRKAVEAAERRHEDLAKQKQKLSETSAAATAMFADATRQVGSLMYMAPELLNGHEYNEKVDVFSFAILMYELFNGRLTAMRSEFMTGGVSSVEEYAQRRAQGEREKIPAKWPAALRCLVEDCWDQNPGRRPSFAVVLLRLRDMQLSRALEDFNGTSASASKEVGCGCAMM